MRVVAVLVVVVAGFAGGAASGVGSAAGSHRVASAVLQNATGVTWSPDGKQIGYTYVPFSEASCGCGEHVRSWIVRRPSSGKGAIRTVRATKKGLAVGSMWWAAGGRILFSSGPFLYSVGEHGGKPKRVVAPDCKESYGCQISGLTLSPNREVAAVGTCDCGDPHLGGFLELVTLARGRESVQMTSLPAAGFLGFSPDSRQLIFSGASGFLALPAAGGSPVPLAQSGIPGASLVPSDAQRVQWSPDGKWIAYVEGDSTDFTPTQTLEVVSTMGGGTPRELAACSFASAGSYPCLNFSWSHDSKMLSYDYTVGQSIKFMTVRPDGTHLTNLLQHRRLTNVHDAQWSPDASRLVFLASRPHLDLVEAWAIRTDGHNLTRLD